MRLAGLLLLLLVPGFAAAQPALHVNLGLSYTGVDEPYAELSAVALTSLSDPVVVSVGVAQAGALFDVSYAPGAEADLDPGFEAFPSYVQRWTAVTVFGGVRLASGEASMQVTAGPVLSVATLSQDDTLVGAGVGVEVGVLDVYPVPSVGLGLSLHGATTTSHSWTGGRLGMRVRL